MPPAWNVMRQTWVLESRCLPPVSAARVMSSSAIWKFENWIGCLICERMFGVVADEYFLAPFCIETDR